MQSYFVTQHPLNTATRAGQDKDKNVEQNLKRVCADRDMICSALLENVFSTKILEQSWEHTNIREGTKSLIHTASVRA